MLGTHELAAPSCTNPANSTSCTQRQLHIETQVPSIVISVWRSQAATRGPSWSYPPHSQTSAILDCAQHAALGKTVQVYKLPIHHPLTCTRTLGILYPHT